MKLIKNLFLIFISITLSIIIAEVLLRYFTNFPKFPNSSFMVQDSNFGFKMDKDLEGIDKKGFRNRDKKFNNFKIAAIGDSHTYGNGVTGEEAWPNQLQKQIKLPVYNFGNSGNGVYSYHYLVKNVLAKNKKIILGLYLPNDFAYKDYVCLIDFNNSFWKKEVVKLNLKPPVKCDSFQNLNTKMDFVNVAIMKSAVLSIVYESIWKPIKKKKKKNINYVKIHKDFPPLENELLVGFMKLTDLENSKILNVFLDFQKMVKDWKDNSEEGTIGIILIPSAQTTYLKALEKLDMAPIQNSKIEFYTKNELLLEEKLLDFIKGQKISVMSVKNYLVEEFIKNLESGNIEQFFPDNSHPIGVGHKAYAKAAEEIFYKMREMSK